jgi:multiple sugar transport system substrate-binding protein
MLRSSAAIATVGVIACPYIANAAAKTATIWWTQGFVEEEDVATKSVVAEYEKASGNKIDLSTGGDVPDIVTANPPEIVALYAYQDKLVDLSGVVETQKALYSETGLLSASCYNSATKRRSYYGAPYIGAALPMRFWKSLVEKAGFKVADIPKTWDAYWDFFKGCRTSCAIRVRATSTASAFR